MTTNDVSDTRISTERLGIIVAALEAGEPDQGNLSMDEQLSAFSELLASRHPRTVIETSEVEREIAIGAAYDFIKPKLLKLSSELGAAGVWSTGYRSGWDAAIRLLKDAS